MSRQDLWRQLIEETHAEVQRIRAERGLKPWNFGKPRQRNRGYCVVCGVMLMVQASERKRTCAACRPGAPPPRPRMAFRNGGVSMRPQIIELLKERMKPKEIAALVGASLSYVYWIRCQEKKHEPHP